MDREVLPWEQPRKKTSSVLGLSQKQIRNVLRFCHHCAGMLLVPYVYSPLGDVAAFELVVRVVLVPLTVFTGVAMWQQAKLRKLIAGGRRG